MMIAYGLVLTAAASFVFLRSLFEWPLYRLHACFDLALCAGLLALAYRAFVLGLA